MKLGVLKEVKKQEGRVGLVPQNIKDLTAKGHSVLVQKNAGILAGFTDADYIAAGAEIVEQTKDLIDRSDIVIKVKEPTIEEVGMMREGQIYFGYLHLAALPETFKKIIEKKIVAFAYDTLQFANGDLPLLAPMSAIAGKLATQIGADFLRADKGGRGILIGGTSTVEPAHVLILGGGVSGRNAADVAIGMGAKTTILEASPQKLDVLKKVYGNTATILLSSQATIAELLPTTDLLIGCVLIPGEKTPKLVTESMVKTMRKGSVIIDVSVDQGGCVETSEVTTHENPIVVKHGVLHYGVANMPGSVPVTATLALNHATFPYIMHLADLGYPKVCETYREMQKALNCAQGEIIHDAIKGII